jgi:hypothetical protein
MSTCFPNQLTEQQRTYVRTYTHAADLYRRPAGAPWLERSNVGPAVRTTCERRSCRKWITYATVRYGSIMPYVDWTDLLRKIWDQGQSWILHHLENLCVDNFESIDPALAICLVTQFWNCPFVHQCFAIVSDVDRCFRIIYLAKGVFWIIDGFFWNILGNVLKRWARKLIILKHENKS